MALLKMFLNTEMLDDSIQILDPPDPPQNLNNYTEELDDSFEIASPPDLPQNPITSFIDLTEDDDEVNDINTSPNVEESVMVLYENIPPVQFVKRVSTTNSPEQIPAIQNVITSSKAITSKSKRRTTTVTQNFEVVGENENTSVRSNIVCAICLEDLIQLKAAKIQVITTICGHMFCKACVDKSMAAKKACPKCRKKLTAKQIIPMYF